MRSIILLASVTLVGAAPPPAPKTPSEVVAQAPAAAWRDIPAEDLMVLQLRNGGEVIIQLAPAFAPVHVANIKILARSNHWDGSAIYRVQDNYVAQWGNGESEKPYPTGFVTAPAAEYHRALAGLAVKPLPYSDAYAPKAGFAGGWPMAYDPKAGTANLVHCYATVGVGRGVTDTGNGGELYAIIGHAPRQLDRNIAVVGRVVEGIERLSSLPRGTEALGFYKDRTQDVPIARVLLASEIAAAARPHFQVMDTMTPTFADYLRLRANRKDDFYIRPAGGVDICNVAVPIRRKPDAAGERG
jgi:peptidylprolyl isomerase